eukprot:1141330-Pelagomonas_calceolata.AAC.6
MGPRAWGMVDMLCAALRDWQLTSLQHRNMSRIYTYANMCPHAWGMLVYDLSKSGGVLLKAWQRGALHSAHLIQPNCKRCKHKTNIPWDLHL